MSQLSQLNALFDEKILKLLNVISKNKSKLYHVTQLAQESNVPAATTLRLVKILVKSSIIKVSDVGKLKIYSYNDTEQNNSFLKVLKL